MAEQPRLLWVLGAATAWISCGGSTEPAAQPAMTDTTEPRAAPPSSAPSAASTTAPAEAPATPASPPEPTPDEACGRGRTTPELTQAIRALAGKTRDCYLELRAAMTGGKSGGVLDVQAAVAHDGTVRSVELTRDTLGSEPVAECVKRTFQEAELPKTAEGCVMFKVPIVFSADDGS